MKNAVQRYNQRYVLARRGQGFSGYFVCVRSRATTSTRTTLDSNEDEDEDDNDDNDDDGESGQTDGWVGGGGEVVSQGRSETRNVSSLFGLRVCLGTMLTSDDPLTIGLPG